MSYDSWLTEPYEQAAENDAAHEAFQKTAAYEQAFEEWLEAERGDE